MKKEMFLFAAAALLTGAACNTYTASTDPADLASGYGFPLENNQAGTGNTSSHGVAEATNNATFDNPATGATPDSLTANQPTDSSNQAANASTGAPVKVQTGTQDH